MGKLTQWIAYINGDLSYRAQQFNLTHFTVDANAKKVRKLLRQRKTNENKVPNNQTTKK